MREKIIFVYNPNAGKKKISVKLNDIVRELVEDNCDLVLSPTKKHGDAKETVMTYLREGMLKRIICSGGDGTLHEVINGMLSCEQTDRRVPLLYIPAGSTNDFGKSLKLPKDMVEIAKLGREGMCYPCDMALFNTEYFVYTAAFGMFTKVSYETKQSMKNVFGHMAYVLNGAASLTHIDKYNMKISYDDRYTEGTFVYGMVVNSESIGGFKGITGKDVSLNDGYYEMLLVREFKAFELPDIINSIRRADYSNPNLLHARVKHVRFECDKPVSYTLDGEFGGECKVADISIRYRAVDFMIPKTLIGLWEGADKAW
ncbi:MAG: diacylglycerol kinase family lipid kinase [Lachnospiraceae bacterium]|nr:diacylglycerol kinase family lipid kinase [Lachnospiraceae bacterium]MBR5667439.1 diacylglycerol kinase family lipid kinase [Lachnospiraceae bacterium]